MAKNKEEGTENPMVKMLTKSVNAKSNGGFIKAERPFEVAEKLLRDGTRGHHELDPTDTNYTWNGSSLIRKPSA